MKWAQAHKETNISTKRVAFVNGPLSTSSDPSFLGIFHYTPPHRNCLYSLTCQLIYHLPPQPHLNWNSLQKVLDVMIYGPDLTTQRILRSFGVLGLEFLEFRGIFQCSGGQTNCLCVSICQPILPHFKTQCDLWGRDGWSWFSSRVDVFKRNRCGGCRQRIFSPYGVTRITEKIDEVMMCEVAVIGIFQWRGGGEKEREIQHGGFLNKQFQGLCFGTVIKWVHRRKLHHQEERP